MGFFFPGGRGLTKKEKQALSDIQNGLKELTRYVKEFKQVYTHLDGIEKDVAEIKNILLEKDKKGFWSTSR